MRQISADYGVLNPEDLLFLQGIFDEVCASSGPMDEGEPASVARKLLVLFKGGTRDRELLKLTVARRGQRAPAGRRGG
jgi:hypothetical protein